MTETDPADIRWVRPLYGTGDVAHDFDHVLRVTRLADRLACAEGAQRPIVRMAALLHDLPAGVGRQSHHLNAADRTRRFLAEQGWEADQIAHVVHCIEAHRFRDQRIRPQSLEARCLYDADKLDSIGAIGVARAFAYAGAYGERLWTRSWPAISAEEETPSGADYTPVHEFVAKLRHLRATLFTSTARSMAASRHDFMVAFFDQLDREMEMKEE